MWRKFLLVLGLHAIYFKGSGIAQAAKEFLIKIIFDRVLLYHDYCIEFLQRKKLHWR